MGCGLLWVPRRRQPAAPAGQPGGGAALITSSSYSFTAAVPEDGGWKVAGESVLDPDPGAWMPPEMLGLMITLELLCMVQ